jgi:hypothetical protein
MNRVESYFKPLMWFMAIVMAAVVAGCGGGGGGAAPAAPAAAAAPIGDVSGVWSVVESDMTADQPQCAPPGNPLANYALTVQQATPATNAITVTDAANASPAADFSGTINGDKLSWSGSFAERGGTTTYNSVNLIVGTDCNTLSGTTTWTYVQDPAVATFSCTGTTTLSATKNGGATCTPPAPPPGSGT